MDNCTGYDKAYLVDYSGGNFNGDTPQEACQKNGVAYGNNYSAVLPNGRCEVGYSGSGDTHAILHVCNGPADTTSPPSTPVTTVSCGAACTVTVVHQLSIPPLQLSPADGGAIATAILGCWAAAYACRMVIRMLRIPVDASDSRDD